MSASDKPQKDHATEGDKSLGLKITEKLLPIFGPPPVDKPTTPVKEATQDEEARDGGLEAELVRKEASDGSKYVEDRGEENAAPEA